MEVYILKLATPLQDKADVVVVIIRCDKRQYIIVRMANITAQEIMIPAQGIPPLGFWTSKSHYYSRPCSRDYFSTQNVLPESPITVYYITCRPTSLRPPSGALLIH